MRHLLTRGGLAASILILAGLASACHSSSSTAVSVTVSPAITSVALEGTTQFTASVANATDTTVTWQVNGVTGGNSICGTISTNGLYTAPSSLPGSTSCAGSTSTTTACTTTTNGTTTTFSGCVLITAISNQDTHALGTAALDLISGVTLSVTPNGTVTVGTGETLQFLATITGTSNLQVNWSVNSTQGGDITTVGSITSTTTGDGTLANAAVYTAPAAVPSPATVTLTAQSGADSSQVVNISVTISTAAPPTFSSVVPGQIPAGAYLEDIYLNGTNFLSTTSVLWNSIDLHTVTGAGVFAVSSTLIRARIPASLLNTPATITVTVEQQNAAQGTIPPSLSLQVVPVRPVLLGAASSSPLYQSSGSGSLQLSGGYYTPTTEVEWNGHSAIESSQGTNLPLTLQANLAATDLSNAGRYSIAVRTPEAVASPRSAINVSVLPSATPTISSTISGFSQTNGISGGPVALAINDVTGIAVVVDQGMNTLDLLDSGYTTIASQVGVGSLPTSVAVDGLRNLALVTDTGDSQSTQTISNIVRSGGIVTATLAAALTIPGGNGVGTVNVTGVMDSSYNGTFVVTGGSGTTTLTWAQALPDGTSTGGSASTGNDVAVVNLAGGTPVVQTKLPCVGTAPVAVAVDEIHGRALVVDQNGGGGTILETAHPMACPGPSQAISSISRAADTVTATFASAITIPGGNGSGIITISGVTDPSFNGTFVVLTGSGTATLTWAQPGPDNTSMGGSAVTGSVLGSVVVATGTQPRVDVLPQMGWAIVTPGGAGNLTVVDLLHSSVVFTSSIITTARGIAVNTETKTALIAEPSSPDGFVFSLLNQTDSSVSMSRGNEAAAVNPFTNVGLYLNPGLHQGILMDLSTPTTIGSPITLGSHPIATAIDAATDFALVADDVDGTVQVLDLGATRSRLATPEPQILQFSPTITMTSSSAVPFTIVGAGFVCGMSGSQVRLEEMALPMGSITSCTSREITGNIPPGFLAQPRRLVVDVQNPSSALSNVFNVLVGISIPVGGSPSGIAIDQDNDKAVVANSLDGTASIIDISPTSLTFGSVISTVTVGNSPAGVGIVSRLGTAVVANGGSSTASVIDMTTNPVTVPSTVTVGGGPSGVGTSESLGLAMVTNSVSNSVDLLALGHGTLIMPSALGIDAGPLGVALAPDLNLAVTANASTSNDAVLMDISTSVPVFETRLTGIPTPVGVEYDPVTPAFLILSSGANSVVGLSPISLQRTSINTGVDPTALAYDFQAGFLVTLNSGSNSLTVIDLFTAAVRDVLPISGSPLYSVAIHRRLEYMVIADSANNQVLLFPLPR